MLVVQAAVRDPQPRSVTISSRAGPAPSSPPTPGLNIGSVSLAQANRASQCLAGSSVPRWKVAPPEQ